MARYSKNYMLSHCIDVFFLFNSRPFHFLTDGCIIPEPLNNIVQNRTIQKQTAIASQEITSRDYITINQRYLRAIRAEALNYNDDSPNDDELISMFLPMASIGFYSYDCIESDEHSATFMLVASPNEGVVVSDDFLLPKYEEIEVIENGANDVPEKIIWRH